MIIVLVSGKAESGKTTTCKILKELLEKEGKRVLKMSYGDYVKYTAKHLFNWDGKKDEAGRQLLQNWGTNIVRQRNADFWAFTVVRLAIILKGDYDYLLIDDVRFPNEIQIWEPYKCFDDLVNIRVERPYYENHLTPEQRQHPSETALDDWMGYNYRINAKDYAELSATVSHTVLPYLLDRLRIVNGGFGYNE